MPTREPKYRVIAADLAERIRAGIHPPGEALPGQRELSVAYGVTLATLRQALQVLQDEGLVSQQPGRGTFVTEPRPAYRLDTLRGLDEDLQAQGHALRTEILGQDLCRPPARVAATLTVPEPDRVLRVERLRIVGDRPAVHQVSWVREPAASRLRATDLGDRSLYAALADVGVVVDGAGEVLRPGVLDERTAPLLRRPVGEPVLLSERVSHAGAAGPVLLDTAVILGTAMEVRAHRAAGGLSLHWARSSGERRPEG
jgi:GntR family transcriptional regulator